MSDAVVTREECEKWLREGIGKPTGRMARLLASYRRAMDLLAKAERSFDDYNLAWNAATDALLRAYEGQPTDGETTT